MHLSDDKVKALRGSGVAVGFFFLFFFCLAC